jgi:putative phosphoribosyl transferase
VYGNRANPEDVIIRAGDLRLAATLEVPPAARGLVVFVHGSGSSRTSPRNRHVAAALRVHRFATLLLDLLTFEEAQHEALDMTLRGDVDFLAERLIHATDALHEIPALAALPLAYFGSASGAAVALIAAARRARLVSAVVSRGGRVDLAGSALEEVRCPTLLLVGDHDEHVLDLNRAAAARLNAPTEVAIVAGASHLFAEPGALDEVARLAAAWLSHHLPPGEPAHASHAGAPG